MQSVDDEFEKYLQEFQPRRPRALPEPVASNLNLARRLAAAAVAAIALGGSLWFAWPRHRSNGNEEIAKRNQLVMPENAQHLSMIPLTEMALKDPHRFDAEMTAASRQVLPNFQRSDSTLRVLAKE